LLVVVLVVRLARKRRTPRYPHTPETPTDGSNYDARTSLPTHTRRSNDDARRAKEHLSTRKVK